MEIGIGQNRQKYCGIGQIQYGCSMLWDRAVLGSVFQYMEYRAAVGSVLQYGIGQFWTVCYNM